MCAYIYICIYVCIYIYIVVYICVYVCIYIYIYMGAVLSPPRFLTAAPPKPFSPKPKVMQFTTLCEHLVNYMSQ